MRIPAAYAAGILSASCRAAALPAPEGVCKRFAGGKTLRAGRIHFALRIKRNGAPAEMGHSVGQGRTVGDRVVIDINE